MNSKSKGNIGEVLALAEFTKRGVQVSIPYGDNARYDLVADFNGKLNRVQVKYVDEKIINGSVNCPCASSKNHTTNKKRDIYTNDVDYMCFYLKQWDLLVLVPIEEIGDRKTINFRKDKPKNNQGNVWLIDNYSFDKTLCVETLYDEPKL